MLSRRRVGHVVVWLWVLAMLIVAGFQWAHAFPPMRLAAHELLPAVFGDGLTKQDKALVTPLAIRDDRTGQTQQWALSEWSGIVFMYDRDCPHCDDNVCNWLDLAAFLVPRGTTTIALAVRPEVSEAPYWSWAKGWLGLRTALDTGGVIKVFGEPRVPTTFLISNGRVVAEFVGGLTQRRARWVVRNLYGETAEREFVTELGS